MKKSISLPDDLYHAALDRLEKLKYNGLSDYVQFLIQQDLEDRPDHVRTSNRGPSKISYRLNEPEPPGQSQQQN